MMIRSKHYISGGFALMQDNQLHDCKSDTAVKDNPSLSDIAMNK